MIIESTSQNLEGWSSSLTKERKTDPTRFEQYVDTLASNMALNDRAMADRRTGSESYRFDPEKWIRYVETKSNEIPGTVLIPREGKIIQIHENTAIPTDPDTKLSKEQVLLAIALTEAKLKVLQPVMENVYPALWKDTMRNLEAKKKEILNPAKHYEPFTIKQAFGVASTLAIVLSACGPTSVITIHPIEDGTPSRSTASATIEAPTYTVEPPTATATATELPPTPEKEFTPEHFENAGLLVNPETRKNEIKFNPEADWNMIYEMIVGGLWEVNMDGIGFMPGFSTDASKFPTKEAFITAAKEGKSMNLGVLVRVDSGLISKEDKGALIVRDRLLVLEKVTVKLDKIKIRVVAPSQIEEATGLPWLKEGQKAYDSASYPGKPGGIAYWSVDPDDGRLVLTVGSAFAAETIYLSDDHNIGNFNPNLHTKWPNRYKPLGLGVRAPDAAALILGATVDELKYIATDDVHVYYDGLDGKRHNVWGVGRAMGYWVGDEFFWEPPLFVW